MKNFLIKHPILFGIFILVVSRIVGLGATFTINAFYPELDPVKDLGWLIQILFASVTVGLIFWTGHAKDFGFSKVKSKKEWLLWIPVLIIPLYIFLSFGFNIPSASRFIVLFIAAVCVAVNEEALFRGVFVKGLLRFGILPTLIVPALLFGSVHLPNIFLGTDPTYAIFQFIWTIAGGIAVIAMRLRNGSILPVIVFHFLLDFTEYSAMNNYGVHDVDFANSTLITMACLNILFMIYALIVLKKSSKNKTLASL